MKRRKIQEEEGEVEGVWQNMKSEKKKNFPVFV